MSGMANNALVRKAIFIAIIFLIIGGILSFRHSSDIDASFRVAFPVTQPALSYEPTNIHLDFEYIFLENIYSPLVEVDAKGIVQPGVAEKVDWEGDDLHLLIRSDLKTQSGAPITANDVAFSLKRLLILSGNTHGNFRDLICPGTQLKSIDESCPGMNVRGNTIVLSAGSRKSFLLPMLSAIDFAIIPKTSVDPVSLAIRDMKETSGPYFVSGDDGKGGIELAVNPHHYHYSKDIPQKITFVPVDSKTKGASLKALAEGRVDHLTTVDSSRSDEILAFAPSHSEYDLHVTMKIRSFILVFTGEGLSEFSDKERRYVGEKVTSAFATIYGQVPGFERRDEFFPGLGDGSLTAEQRAGFEKLRADKSTALHKNIRLALLRRNNVEAWSVPIRHELPNADTFQMLEIPDFKKDLAPKDRPHAYIIATDTGFIEDIVLLSYSLNAGYFGLQTGERSHWLADYMAIDQKKERMDMLRKLHFEALSKPVLVPLMSAPYTALTRKPWKMELSDLYANNQLWQIQRR